MVEALEMMQKDNLSKRKAAKELGGSRFPMTRRNGGCFETATFTDHGTKFDEKTLREESREKT